MFDNCVLFDKLAAMDFSKAKYEDQEFELFKKILIQHMSKYFTKSNLQWGNHTADMIMLNRCLFIALEAHRGQTDKYGHPYIWHPITVALMLDSPREIMVALLHDVIEDSPLTRTDLENLGVTAKIASDVVKLSHFASDNYMRYIRSIVWNEPGSVPLKVKYCDLLHNSNVARGVVLNKTPLRPNPKYAEALKLIESRLDAEDKYTFEYYKLRDKKVVQELFERYHLLNSNYTKPCTTYF